MAIHVGRTTTTKLDPTSIHKSMRCTNMQNFKKTCFVGSVVECVSGPGLGRFS